MSFLAGRLASTEGAYFLQESKLAVGRLIQKNKKTQPPSGPSSPSSSSVVVEEETQADVLPEILRHSLPSKIFQPLSESSISKGSKWVLPQDPIKRSSVSADALNPLRSYLSLPQVTFGPKRWQLPEGENSVLASTANELRTDRYTSVNPDKLKAAAAGLSQISAAFAIATAVVFGGATLTFGLAVSKLDVQNGDDIKTKARDLLHPAFEGFDERLVPLRIWADNMSKKWRIEREEVVKENRLVKELSKSMGVRTPN